MKYLKIPIIPGYGYENEEQAGIRRTEAGGHSYVHLEDGTNQFVSKEAYDLMQEFLVTDEISGQSEPELDLKPGPAQVVAPPEQVVSAEDAKQFVPNAMEDLRKTLIAIGEMSRGIRS